jgi:hypothetical protein
VAFNASGHVQVYFVFVFIFYFFVIISKKDVYDMPPVPAKTAGVGTGNGFMDYKSIPLDPYSRGYVCGTNDNQMYLLRHGQPPLHVCIVKEYIYL